MVVGTAPEHVDEVLRIVTGELELLAEHGVTDRELAIAKGNLRAETLLACEDSGARMSRIGAALLLHGEVRTVDEILARVEAVSPRGGPRRGRRRWPRRRAPWPPWARSTPTGSTRQRLGLAGQAV